MSFRTCRWVASLLAATLAACGSSSRDAMSEVLWRADVDVLHAQVLVPEAVNGDMSAFDELGRRRDALEATFTAQSHGDIPASARAAWLPVRDRIDAILAQRQALVALYDAAAEVAGESGRALQEMDEAARLLIESRDVGDPRRASQQIYLIGRDAWLVRSLQRRLDGLPRDPSIWGEWGLAESLRRDSTVLRQSLTGLCAGNSDLGIDQVTDSAARARLCQAAQRFDQLQLDGPEWQAAAGNLTVVMEATIELPIAAQELRRTLHEARIAPP